MRKSSIIIISLIVLSFSTRAQYIFDNCGSHAAFGDSLVGNLYQYDTTGIKPGSAGINRVWNFANLSLAYTWPLSHYYFDPSATEGVFMFPGAEVADRRENGVYSYLKYSYDSTTFFGDYLDSVNFHKSWDPQKNMACALSYGGSFTDFFSRYNFSQCPYHHTYSNRTITYDGYGTIYLPDDTFSAARLKIIESTLDTAICVGPAVISVTLDTTYLWYDVNSRQPVFSWHRFSDSAHAYMNIIVEEYSYTHLPQIVASVHESGSTSDLNIYPNPSNGVFDLQLSKAANAQINIYNVYGACVRQMACTSGKQQIDLSSQPDGIYFLNVVSADVTSSRKIIIVR